MKFNIKLISYLAFLIIYQTAFAQQSDNTIDTYRMPGESKLSNIRMLTEDGENAEAYLSFDEKKLTFQSTHGQWKCDQIFTMNIDGTEKKLVSTGKGRTTCAYFLPGDDKILYASTHLESDDCPPPPDRSKGYVWKLYESFDIFSANADGSDVKQLTNTPGYDAEATVSPKGDKIIFTSTRDGDPELYVMDIDGSNQKRLTFEKGYDGGAFFSQDGSKIVFRASRPKSEKDLEDYNDLVKNGYVRPTALEIFVMNADGSEMKQITNLGKASFAPFLHPDGKRIIFSSNANSKSGRDFDLYTINIDGTNLQQITYFESFDGFPMFTRDGKKLIFASNRFSKNEGDTNIFIADWTD
ncbi:MAG: PD40 domain-containing protein [Ignavibacteriales bacterium]|nr:MAG: PD40 domain-containing protein [Ignavibacteriales bacterium]